MEGRPGHRPDSGYGRSEQEEPREKMTQESVIENSGAVHPRLSERLREANLMGAFTEVTTPRFTKYLLQPKHILRNGWLLDPDLELGQRSVRSYVLGDLPKDDSEAETAVGQRLEIDRERRVATLETYCESQSQTIEFDMTSFTVLANRLS